MEQRPDRSWKVLRRRRGIGEAHTVDSSSGAFHESDERLPDLSWLKPLD
jgi:hypothetical protein